jgi:DnaJ-class molecular chaperone
MTAQPPTFTPPRKTAYKRRICPASFTPAQCAAVAGKMGGTGCSERKRAALKRNAQVMGRKRGTKRIACPVCDDTGQLDGKQCQACRQRRRMRALREARAALTVTQPPEGAQP